MGRALAVLVLVLGFVGCVSRSSDPVFDPDPGWGDPPGPGTSGRCRSNADCASSAVCARNSACVALDQVRAIHVSWTVSGAPANSTSCAAAPELAIEFDSATEGHLSYAPVPCIAGKYTMDLLPRSFDHVALGREDDRERIDTKVDPVTGDAMLDLPY